MNVDVASDSLVVDRILGRSIAARRVRGSDSLSVADVLERRPKMLQQLEYAVDKDELFTDKDTRRFNEIMHENFRDSPIHFGSNTHWKVLRSVAKRNKEVPAGVSRVFGRNPEAACALLEEMAHSWTDPTSRSRQYFSMTKAAVLKQVEMLRADRAALLCFIGSRYAIGEYRQAAMAFKHALKLANQPLPGEH
jgi:hypothetical protein